jgi:CHASE2 domain-containing sensor protein
MNSSLRGRFWRHMLVGMVLVAVATLLTVGLHESWIVRKVEESNLAALETLLSHPHDSQIAIVEIDDQDYKSLFHNTSPLAPEKVAVLINAIDAGGAAVIGVDIDTSEWTREQLGKVKTHVPVVWAKQGNGPDNEEVDSFDCLASDDTHAPSIILTVDGATRRYHRYLNCADGPKPTFTTLLLRRAHKLNAELDKDTKELPVPFECKPEDLMLQSASTLFLKNDYADMHARQPFQGRIVLLGGGFRAGRDERITPFGQMQGVEVLANILQAEIGGRRIRSAGPVIFVFADLLVGFVLVYAAWILQQRCRAWSLLVMLVATPSCVVLVSMICFAAWRYYVSFAPVVAGLLVHLLVEDAYELHCLRTEVVQLKKLAEGE